MESTSKVQQAISEERNLPQFIKDIEELVAEIQYLYCLDEVPWVVGYSGGKDSTSVLQLVWTAISKLPKKKRKKQVFVITTDTLVENPIVSAWVASSLKRIRLAAQEQELPIEPHLLKPKLQDTFWVNLIGRGYPSPRHGFRWCTERLKIWPTNHFIRDVVRVQGEVIVVLGTRKAESQTRAASMASHENEDLRERFKAENLHTKSAFYTGLPDTLIYSPIEDWRNDEVWIYLNQYPNPWGHSNKELFSMYRGATADTECPLVIDKSTPSCGDSRFGCWVCTMVNKDKSMAAMIQNDEEKEWMQPLLDIRNELDLRSDYERRDFRRMSGKVQLVESKVNGDVVPISGPYEKQWREHWLRRVLSAQKLVRQKAPTYLKNIELITEEELSEIRRIWLDDKHEFDDALPSIYREVFGEEYRDIRPHAGNQILGITEWEILKDISDDPMHMELMVNLLDTERQFQMMSRRKGVLDALENCFVKSSRDKEEAIATEMAFRSLKKSSEAGDIEQVREHLEELDVSTGSESWASIKFQSES
jgi:DNA sulfur modification protein DndC